MGRAGRPTATIELSDAERETLQRWVRRRSSAQALAERCRIVLACAEGATTAEVAAAERVHPATVSKWRRRFAAEGLEGLSDAPRPGAERTIADETIEAVLVDTPRSNQTRTSHRALRRVHHRLAGKAPGCVRRDGDPDQKRVRCRRRAERR